MCFKYANCGPLEYHVLQLPYGQNEKFQDTTGSCVIKKHVMASTLLSFSPQGIFEYMLYKVQC